MISSNFKILFITRAYGERAGGLERFSFELIRAVSKHPNVNSEIIKHTGSRLTSPLFIITVIPRALLAARRADVVHLSDPMLSLAGWLIKKILHKPVAVNVHGLDITYPNFLYQTYLRLFFRHLDAYFPISRHVNTILARWRVFGTQTVINPGISDIFFDPTVKKTTSNCVTLLTVGRLVKRKGHAWFITNVLPHLPKNITYIIAGEGPEVDNIKQAAEQHNVSSRVTLLGKVSPAKLKILYNTVDGFIQPNIKIKNDTEGFGLVLLEAALCNLPVYAADIDGIPDAVQNNQNGILVTSGDAEAWTRILRRPISTPRNSRQYTFNKFSWDIVADKYYQSLITLPAR
ncbi:MAG: glycosyltransferase family 4 protein [bacterium]